MIDPRTMCDLVEDKTMTAVARLNPQEELEFIPISVSYESDFSGKHKRKWKKFSFDMKSLGEYVGVLNVYIGKLGAWHYFQRNPNNKHQIVVYQSPMEMEGMNEDQILVKVQKYATECYEHVIECVNNNEEPMSNWTNVVYQLQEREPEISSDLALT